MSERRDRSAQYNRAVRITLGLIIQIDHALRTATATMPPPTRATEKLCIARTERSDPTWSAIERIADHIGHTRTILDDQIAELSAAATALGVLVHEDHRWSVMASGTLTDMQDEYWHLTLVEDEPIMLDHHLWAMLDLQRELGRVANRLRTWWPPTARTNPDIPTVPCAGCHRPLRTTTGNTRQCGACRTATHRRKDIA